MWSRWHTGTSGWVDCVTVVSLLEGLVFVGTFILNRVVFGDPSPFVFFLSDVELVSEESSDADNGSLPSETTLWGTRPSLFRAEMILLRLSERLNVGGGAFHSSASSSITGVCGTEPRPSRFIFGLNILMKKPFKKPGLLTVDFSAMMWYMDGDLYVSGVTTILVASSSDVLYKERPARVPFSRRLQPHKWTIFSCRERLSASFAATLPL